MVQILLDQPLNITTEIIGFRILENVSVTLFSSVTIYIALTYKYGEKQWEEERSIKLTNEEYNNWGNDDTYIIDLVKSRINELI